MQTYDSQTIKEIVTQNFRTASVFEKYSLDFCCKGGVTIADACRDKQIDPLNVFADLHNLNNASDNSHQRFNQWDVDFLTTYIISNHHEYVRQATPALLAHTQKVAAVHGERHPEMKQVANLFGVVANEMMSHMHKEEHILFPYIITLGLSAKENKLATGSPFGTVRNPIRLMEQEHESAGSIMYEIRELTNKYVIPDDACTTYRVTLKELQEFEHDLHQHVHLENNILFPKATAIEESLLSQRKN